MIYSSLFLALLMSANSVTITVAFQTVRLQRHVPLPIQQPHRRVASYSQSEGTTVLYQQPSDRPFTARNGTDETVLQQTDMAKEIFLENSRENLALVKMFENEQTQHEKSTNDQKSNLSVPTARDLDVEATIKVILAASKQAVADAEASLDHDVAARLEPFAATTSSTTDGATPPPHDAVVQEILPAASVVGAVVDRPTAPSVGRILRFAIPAIGVWLCDPLLSLIDTSAVGMLSGTVQQAALTPACAVTDYAALLAAFVFTATTNLIASARESDKGVKGSPRMTRNLIGSLQLSTYVGGALGAVLFCFARTFVKAIMGSGAVNPAVVDAATIYVQIRALGMPAAAMIGSAQAACLGMQDIKSQFIVLAAAALVNLLGDMIFVGSKNALIGGAAGAAWATIFSQYAAVALFAHWLCNKPKNKTKAKTMNLSSAILDLTGKRNKRSSKLQDTIGSLASENMSSPRPEKTGIIATTKRFFGKKRAHVASSNNNKILEPNTIVAKEKPFSVQGFLDGKIKMHEMLHFPSRNIIKEFQPYFVPVTSAQIGRVSGYVAMSYVVASSLGTLAMAAQQIVASLVYCLFPVADSLSLTGQAFVPPIMEKSATKERAAALRQTMLNLSKAAGVFGLFTAGVFAFTPLVSGYLTSDPMVTSMVNSVVPMLVASFPVYALTMAFEGFLLGQKDLAFQGKMYTFWCFLVPYFMLRVKKATLGGASAGITAVWGVLCAYQVKRLLTWGVRALFLQRRVERDTKVSAAPV